MSLVWHIVRKDFRRLRWPLVLWLALPLVHWTLLTRAAGSRTTGMNPAAFEGMKGFSEAWEWLTWAVGGILAAWLVMEDGLVGTRVFWRTRPVSPARLFAAKALGASLMFGVLSVLLMIPVWAMNGFAAGELALAAAELFLKQILFVVAAFAIAGVTETAGQFLVRVIATTILVPLTFGYCAGIFDRRALADADGLTETRYRLALAVFVLTPLVMVVHQYLTGRRARTYGLLAAGVALMFAVRFGWQWDLTPAWRRFPTESTPSDADVRIALDPLARTDFPEQLVRLDLSGSVTGAPAGTYVDFDAVRTWWPDGRGFRSGAKFKTELQQPIEAATDQVGGANRPVSEPMPWKAFSFEREKTFTAARPDASNVQIAIRARLMRGRVLGELPLRAGAVLRSGSSFTRITGVERVEGRLIVWLEERRAWPPWSPRAQDTFLLRDPAVGPEASYTPITADRGLQFASIWLHQRQLSIAIPLRDVDGRIREIPGWEESARLVKVHFTPEEPFTKILAMPLPTRSSP